MSKGSNRRPTDEKKFSENYDSIFRKEPEPLAPSTGVCIGEFFLCGLADSTDEVYIGHRTGEAGHFSTTKLEQTIQEFWNKEF